MRLCRAARGGTEDKELILVRHAKSQAQGASRGERRRSHSLLDARLHEDGLEQTAALRERVKNNAHLREVDIVLCSPLTRALQTACVSFEHSEARILVVPELAEFALTSAMSGYENVGRPWKKVAHDEALTKLPKFKDVDPTLVLDYEKNYGDKWWSRGYDRHKVEMQVERMKKLLVALPFKRVAVVGHCCNFMVLLSTFRRVPNCTPMHCTIHQRPDGRIEIIRRRRLAARAKQHG